ncbi:acetyl-CoA carboxylase biotin carboxyl carrier protein [Caproiciproducens sp. LBM24188]|nr:acetyl-CoA carboxylase biotin carboxyl carrier protein [Oscillospiraceae bacterium]HHV31479.1 acetyl-CoA carboxylase biotin carboxyl carrier protein [Clostridiales bacterium]
MDVKQIQEIAEVMRDNGLTLLELTQGDVSLRMERQPAQNIIIPAQGLGPAVAETAPAAAPEPHAPADPNCVEVKAPMVGVFYQAPAPDAEPFAPVGAHVNKGDTLCVIEAMKLMNEINAECSGKVAEVCVKNGQTVEYGQVLMKIIRE